MDRVLIVDKDQELLTHLKDGLDKLHQFKVLTAADGEEAVELLSRENVAVFVTDINVPKMNGLKLLAYITQHHSAIPCIVMTDYGKPWFRKRFDQKEVLYHLEKPFDIGSLTSAIVVALNLRDEGMTHKGIHMSSLLPLVEAEQKTCRMEVTSSQKGKGYLYFDTGALIDAHHKDLSGEDAAREISSWDRITIKFSDLPRGRKRTRVKTNLMDMAGATWSKEETGVSATDSVDLSEDATLDSDVVDFSDGAVLDFDTSDLPEEVVLDLGLDGEALSEKDAAIEVLTNHIDELRTIKGYIAIGILNADGEMLAHDTADQSIEIEHLAFNITSIFTVSQELTTQTGLDECEALTFHTQKGNVLYVTTELESESPFRLIGMTTPDGNWFYMKVQLSNLFPKLAELVQ